MWSHSDCSGKSRSPGSHSGSLLIVSADKLGSNLWMDISGSSCSWWLKHIPKMSQKDGLENESSKLITNADCDSQTALAVFCIPPCWHGWAQQSGFGACKRWRLEATPTDGCPSYVLKTFSHAAVVGSFKVLNRFVQSSRGMQAPSPLLHRSGCMTAFWDAQRWSCWDSPVWRCFHSFLP